MVKRRLYSKIIPVEGRPYPSFSKVPASEYRLVLQSYFPSLPKQAPQDGRFSINLLFRINGHKSKSHPKADLDNLIKPVIDAGTGFFWHDDSQVDEIVARVKRHCHKSSIRVNIFEEVERLANVKSSSNKS